MVVKLARSCGVHISGFESRVILDGSQTTSKVVRMQSLFESRVILDGSQTEYARIIKAAMV